MAIYIVERTEFLWEIRISAVLEKEISIFPTDNAIYFYFSVIHYSVCVSWSVLCLLSPIKRNWMNEWGLRVSAWPQMILFRALILYNLTQTIAASFFLYHHLLLSIFFFISKRSQLVFLFFNSIVHPSCVCFRRVFSQINEDFIDWLIMIFLTLNNRIKFNWNNPCLFNTLAHIC